MSQQITRTDTSVSPFTVLLSATRKGARLARLLGTERIRSWGLPHETAALIIAELAANAALHGRVPGRNFRLTLTVTGSTLRIEVRDPRVERLPTVRPAPEHESRHRRPHPQPRRPAANPRLPLPAPLLNCAEGARRNPHVFATPR
ncbi:ATP-binding protein [Streptomyces violaceusniger]|uniref:ATP-binding protein n=1 Tax=Streptomyces violaceusniger TaxID=68280 RepID=UPI003822BCEA